MARLALALAGLSSCATPARYVALEDVDPALGAAFGNSPSLNGLYDHDGAEGPERPEFRVSWVDLCGPGVCADYERRLTRLFREAAIISATLRQTEFVLQALDDGGPSPADEAELRVFALRAIPAARERLARVADELVALGPMRGTLSKHLVEDAEHGRRIASDQIADATRQLPHLEENVARLEPAVDPKSCQPQTVSIEFHASPLDLSPRLENKLEVVRERMHNGAAMRPISRDDALGLALIRGLDALDRELQAVADEDQEAHVLIHLDGPEVAVREWFAAQRIATEQCLTEADVEVSVAGFYGPSGGVTALQVMTQPSNPAMNGCTAGALNRGALNVADNSGGTFKFLLTPPMVAPGATESVLGNDVAERVGMRASEVATLLPNDDPAGPRYSISLYSTGQDIKTPAVPPEPALPYLGFGVGSSALIAALVLWRGAIDTRNVANNADAVDPVGAGKRSRSYAQWAAATAGLGVAMVGLSATALVFSKRKGGSRLTLGPQGGAWSTQF